MSVRALTWSFNLRLDDMAAKSALHALADHADDRGRCWPSIRRIALFMGASPQTARRALQRLAKLGIITRKPQTGQTDIYVINFGWASPSQIGRGDQIEPSQPDQPPLPSCRATPPNATTNPFQPGSRTVKNPQINRHGSAEDDRPLSKAAGRNAFMKALRDDFGDHRAHEARLAGYGSLAEREEDAT